MFPSLIDGDFSSLATTFLSVDARTSDPPWVFDWEQVWHIRVVLCAVLLGTSAVLSSASGIGGGGIFVVLLMVVSGLTPHDAVPLSKIVVFAGALASLCLNMKRQLTGHSSPQKKAVIDGVACTLVVPTALLGTYLGVLANTHASDSVIIALLNLVLVVLAVSVFRTGMRQREEEDAAAVLAVEDDRESEAVEAEPRSGVNPQDDAENDQDDGFLLRGMERREDRRSRDPEIAVSVASSPIPEVEQTAVPRFLFGKFEVPKGKDLQLPTFSESFIGILLAVLVVLAGIMQFHFNKCMEDLRMGYMDTPSCTHPIARTMNGWTNKAVHDPSYHHRVSEVLMIPIWGCCVVGTFSGLRAYHFSEWSFQAIVLYQATAVSTGYLAGLVGIGGGLIFAPFFVVTGMESAVAVGTSATCVFFTSSSTTFQYLLEDRMIMSLAAVYSAVTSVGSLLGTSLVHNLQDKGTRKSHITFIVLGGIIVSLLLSMFKLGYMLREAAPGVPAHMKQVMAESWS